MVKRASCLTVSGLAVMMFGWGCAVPAAPNASQPARPAAPTRITVGMLGVPPTFWNISGSPGTAGGTGELQGLVTAGLTVVDDSGLRRPQLSEAVPSTDNGLWKVFPDGRMETTWVIRAGALWHDGAPFSSDDLLFTTRVGQDGDLAVFGNAAYAAIESIEAADPQTVTVTWKRPYVRADMMFDAFAQPPWTRFS